MVHVCLVLPLVLILDIDHDRGQIPSSSHHIPTITHPITGPLVLPCRAFLPYLSPRHSYTLERTASKLLPSPLYYCIIVYCLFQTVPTLFFLISNPYVAVYWGVLSLPWGGNPYSRMLSALSGTWFLGIRGELEQDQTNRNSTFLT